MKSALRRISRLAMAAAVICGPYLYNYFYQYLYSQPGPHGPLA